MYHLCLTKKPLMVAMAVLLIVTSLLSTAGSAWAQGNGAALGGNALAAPSQPNGPTDPAELEAFLNGLFEKEMAEYHIAGAAVSVVKDGRLFFAKGYGYADLEKRIPVDPEQTGFRIGSVTKLFTWTAVMQLVEQGKLDLDADINIYLDFHIPDTYPQPITLKHLITHTAGFEDRFFEYLALDAKNLQPARGWLAAHIPARVRPPGEIAAYSNYGASLAGYIVARVAGEPYEQYVEEHILNPLGMVHTSARCPQPRDLSARATMGYTYKDGAYKKFPDYLGQTGMVPAGAMQASATDIARFMIAHLQNGRYSDANIAEVRILKESTARQMHSPLYTPDPRLLGTAYGFFDFSDNGQWTLGHSGEADPINSLLLLLPDQNLGVFVTYNSEGGGNLTNQHLGFQRAFFDHYFPAPALAPVQPPADFARRSSRFAGLYRLTRSSYTTLEKVNELMGGTIEIKDLGDGALIFATPWGDWRFIEVAPLTFRQENSPSTLVFRTDGTGRITTLFTSITPMFAFEKLDWYETPAFNMALLLGCILVFLSILPVALVRYLRSRRLGGEQKPAPHDPRTAQWLFAAVSVVNLLFIGGTMLWGNPAPLFGISLLFRIVLGFGVLSAILTVGALVYTALAWKNHYWGIADRVYCTLVTVAAAGFVWFLNTWNLLGWRF